MPQAEDGVADVGSGISTIPLGSVPAVRTYRGTLRFRDREGRRFKRRVAFGSGPASECPAPGSRVAIPLDDPSDPGSEPGDQRQLPALGCADRLPPPAPEADSDSRCELQPWLRRLRASPDDPSVYCILEGLLRRCGSAPEALHQLDRIIDEFPERAQTWMLVARLQPTATRSSDPEQRPTSAQTSRRERLQGSTVAIEALERAAELAPDDIEVQAGRAMAYQRRAEFRSPPPDPSGPGEWLEFILAQEDTMSAWRAQRRVCELDARQPCPPSPLSAAQELVLRDKKAKLVREISTTVFTENSPQPLFTPAPSRRRLRQTRAAREREGGPVRVSYCVGPRGRTEGVVVVDGFESDRQLRAVVRSAVERWRFAPARSASAPRCTTVALNVRFD